MQKLYVGVCCVLRLFFFVLESTIDISFLLSVEARCVHETKAVFWRSLA